MECGIITVGLGAYMMLEAILAKRKIKKIEEGIIPNEDYPALEPCVPFVFGLTTIACGVFMLIGQAFYQ